MPISDHVAQIAIFVSFYGALGMAALLLFLVIRRDRAERGEAQRAALIKALIREIMGGGEDALASPAFRRARTADKLAAIGRMIQLLRGEDRNRLIALVERDGLLKKALRRTHSSRRRAQVDAMRMFGSIGGTQAVQALMAGIREAVAGGAFDGLSLGAGVRYVGALYGDNANLFKSPDTAFFDLAAAYDLGKLDRRLDHFHLRVNLRNVFDTYYVTCTSVNACYPAEGRTALATLTYKW